MWRHNVTIKAPHAADSGWIDHDQIRAEYCLPQCRRVVARVALEPTAMKVPASRLLFLTAAVMGLLTAVVIAYVVWSRPVHLRVAAGPQDGVDAAVLAAFDRLLEVNRATVRLALVTTAGLNETNQRRERRQVARAAVRLDDSPPTVAAIVALLRTNVVIAVAPARLKLENFSDLKGKRVGSSRSRRSTSLPSRNCS